MQSGSLERNQFGTFHHVVATTRETLRTIAEWNAPDKQAQGVIVTLSRILPFGVKGQPSNGGYVRVNWGTEGCGHEAEVDYGQNSVFAVYGSYVRITAHDETLSVKTQPMGGSIAFGARGGLPPTRTRYKFGNLAPAANEMLEAYTDGNPGPLNGGLLEFPIPVFARQCVFLRDVLEPVTINFQNFVFGTVYSFVIGAGQQSPIMPVTANVDDIQVVNNGANNITARRFVFDLMLS